MLSFHCFQDYIIVLLPNKLNECNRHYITAFYTPYHIYSYFYVITITVYQTCPKLLEDPKFQKFNLSELRTCSSNHISQTECLLSACSSDIVRNSKGFES